jgi:NAD+ diphosphatase
VTPTHEILEDLALATAGLDRVARERRDPEILDRLLADPDSRVIEVRDGRARVRTEGGRGQLELRPPAAADRLEGAVLLGRDKQGVAHVAVLSSADPDGEDTWLTLWRAGTLLAPLEAALFSSALALANWHASHARCSRCGEPTVPVQAGWVRRCPRDGSEHYPRTDPAVIMSVIDPDDRLLLGRSPQWPQARFSVLAGFVEPGESLEQAVAREVFEEVGIPVDDVRYLGNQPWPFPSSVMIGFAAHTSEVELTLDPVEMAEARWVTRDEYRTALRADAIRTPTGISIAKRIIEHWLGETIESVVAT